MSNIHVSKDINALSLDFANWLVDYAEEVLTKKDNFTIALSGGSTPKLLHELLVKEPFFSRIDWAKWIFFMGDERFVPETDDRSNAKMAYETMLNHVLVPKEHIHFYQTEGITPVDSAIEYEKLLKSYFEGKETGLDLVILGMGDDGHTLSLFPGQPIIHETAKWVDSFWLEAQDMYRITLTHPVANHAAQVAFLVSGEKKVHALHEVLKGAYNPDLYPSQIIKPNPGELHFFIDEAAAEGLK
ncbi:MAG: 6-phosphogluconolactonase [Pseudopedobacter saltans]|uniref:6-phosphogluconolactonase n=1 Tax=Pseudopedobacter saltans TaxID=151895 RepID=A0A2W5FB75_9SPHI|nr:MAG: 6-phosphogluconolactonase [Pseudopedobacter saltans]